LAICLAAIASAWLPATAGAVTAATPEKENLVRAYAPILMMRAQENPVGG
jgi:hypothetical protein